MKKTFFTIMAVASLVFASCGDKANKTEGNTTSNESTLVEPPQADQPKAAATVVGTWKLTEFDMGMEVPKGKEKAFEDMKKKMLAETSFTFNEDGTMSATNPVVKESQGTYTYEDSKLTITDAKSKKAETLAVDELTADKLVISSGQNERKAVMTFSR
jgi:major membrane immunogen (membrane-anchored lipoprotein)